MGRYLEQVIKMSRKSVKVHQQRLEVLWRLTTSINVKERVVTSSENELTRGFSSRVAIRKLVKKLSTSFVVIETVSNRRNLRLPLFFSRNPKVNKKSGIWCFLVNTYLYWVLRGCPVIFTWSQFSNFVNIRDCRWDTPFDCFFNALFLIQWTIPRIFGQDDLLYQNRAYNANSATERCRFELRNPIPLQPHS